MKIFGKGFGGGDKKGGAGMLMMALMMKGAMGAMGNNFISVSHTNFY
jgi:hypothetical protein